MTKTEGKGLFIYGDKPKDTVSVTWRLTFGKILSNEESWRAEILSNSTKSEKSGMGILAALERDFIFKLQTEDGAEFPCGIYDLDYFWDTYPTTLYFEICSRDQEMVEYSINHPSQS